MSSIQLQIIAKNHFHFDLEEDMPITGSCQNSPNLTSQVEMLSSKVDMLSKPKSYEKANTDRFQPSIDDTAKDEKIIIDTFMREANLPLMMV